MRNDNGMTGARGMCRQIMWIDWRVYHYWCAPRPMARYCWRVKSSRTLHIKSSRTHWLSGRKGTILIWRWVFRRRPAAMKSGRKFVSWVIANFCLVFSLSLSWRDQFSNFRPFVFVFGQIGSRQRSICWHHARHCRRIGRWALWRDVRQCTANWAATMWIIAAGGYCRNDCEWIDNTATKGKIGHGHRVRELH